MSSSGHSTDGFFDLDGGVSFRDILRGDFADADDPVNLCDSRRDNDPLKLSNSKRDNDPVKLSNPKRDNDKETRGVKRRKIQDLSCDELLLSSSSQSDTLTPPPELAQELLTELEATNKLLKEKSEKILPSKIDLPEVNEVDIESLGSKCYADNYVSTSAHSAVREIINITMKFASWKKNTRLSKPAKIRIISEMIERVTQRRKLNRQNVVFLFNSTELFEHGTPVSVNMPRKALVGRNHFCIFASPYGKVLSKADYEDKLRKEFKKFENPCEHLSCDNDPENLYLVVKISQKDGITTIKLPKTALIEDVLQSYLTLKAIPKTKTSKLFFDGELLDPGLRLCDLEIDDNDLLDFYE